ncbi:Methylmalonyl-CoA mutase small subunit, MutA [hydrothermal vent metagenome]|uniref:Methylmalonyl-CoA mutase small subunit, MutA n=1 Tax=hydrothermal vent metagenome TaxID=652676 RepID=A0A3B0RV27_9ZZZZ
MAKLTLAAEFPEVSQDDWRRQAEATLKSGDIGQLVSKTGDGIAVQPIYETPTEAFANLANHPKPEGPAWKIVQRSDIPDIAAANRQILDDLLNGATAISMVLPGAATAGSFGVPVQSVGDIKRLMKNVELDLIAVRLDTGSGGHDVAASLLQVYQARNLDLSRCDLSFCLDPVAEFALSGTTGSKIDIAGRMVTLMAKTREAGHRGLVFAGDGRPYHEAGASQAQELGFAIAAVVEQLRLLESGGAALKNIWPQLGLLLSADADQFLTIAKLRAARLVWARLQEAMGSEPSRLQLDVETSLAMMSKIDPNVNMLRTTTAAFAAGIGGADSISVLPFSCALGVADGFARRIARNCQIVLQEESGIGVVGDAAAGSGYVEEVTYQIAAKAWQLMQEIDAAGGMIAALCNGQVQSLVEKSALRTRQAVRNGDQIIVGVNKFTATEEAPVNTLDYLPVESPSGKTTGEMMCNRLRPVAVSSALENLDGAKP